MAYMQSITPSLSLGGMGQYSLKTSTLSTSIGGIYSHGENVLAAQWDKNVRYLLNNLYNSLYFSYLSCMKYLPLGSGYPLMTSVVISHATSSETFIVWRRSISSIIVSMERISTLPSHLSIISISPYIIYLFTSTLLYS